MKETSIRNVRHVQLNASNLGTMEVYSPVGTMVHIDPCRLLVRRNRELEKQWLAVVGTYY